jgi:predicted MFS family arabinose efflux permease
MDKRDSTPPYAWYVLALLLAAYTFNWMDRYVLVILIEPMKADLHLSDTVIGLVGGFAFAVIYSVAGIPIARWADRGNRRSIIVLGVSVWSAMTFCGGLARNAIQLVTARLGVALGESACSPTAHSLISDYFPVGRRATALSVYQIGITTGIALGLAIGGWANDRYGWRYAFMIVGLPGLLLALLISQTVREPARGQSEQGADTAARSLRDTLAVMISRKSFLAYAVALGLCSFADTAFEMWSPAYLMRVYHLSSAYVGSRTGLLEAIAGLSGTLAGGVIADRLGLRDPRWYLWVPVISVTLLIPSIFLFLTAGVDTVFVFYFFSMFIAGSYMGPVVGLTQRLMPVRMRALAASIQFLILNLLGPGAGVSSVGILSDALASRYGVLSLRYALIISLSAAIAGIALFAFAAQRLPRDLKMMQSVAPGPGDARAAACLQ